MTAGDGTRAMYRVRPGIAAPRPALPSKGVARQVGGQVDLAASAGLPAALGVEAKVSGGATSTRVRQDILQPFWKAIGGTRDAFRLLDHDEGMKLARAAPLDLQKRQQAILNHAVRLAPTLARLGARQASEMKPGGLPIPREFVLKLVTDRAQLHRILERMEDQFDLYCFAAREVASGKPEAAKLMRDFGRIWNVGCRVRGTAYV